MLTNTCIYQVKNIFFVHMIYHNLLLHLFSSMLFVTLLGFNKYSMYFCYRLFYAVDINLFKCWNITRFFFLLYFHLFLLFWKLQYIFLVLTFHIILTSRRYDLACDCFLSFSWKKIIHQKHVIRWGLDRNNLSFNNSAYWKLMGRRMNLYSNQRHI